MIARTEWWWEKSWERICEARKPFAPVWRTRWDILEVGSGGGSEDGRMGFGEGLW